MNYKFGVYDLLGRKWAQTMTRIKAARLVEMLRVSRGLICTIKAL